MESIHSTIKETKQQIQEQNQKRKHKPKKLINYFDNRARKRLNK